MQETFLRKVKKTLIPTSRESEDTLEAYPEGVILRVKIWQKRSLPHHRFFFAFLNEVYEEWPYTHPFQPHDKEHLRAWLTVRSGYFEMFEWDCPDPEEAQRSMRVMRAFVKQRAGSRPVWFKVINRKIFGAWPKSIAFENMDEHEFRQFTTAVFTMIYAESGLDVEEHYERWKNEHGSLQVVPARQKEESDRSSANLYFC